MSLKPVMTFKIGAVYAFRRTDGEIKPCLCTWGGDRSSAFLVLIGDRYVNLKAVSPHMYGNFYRIRARDWDTFVPDTQGYELTMRDVSFKPTGWLRPYMGGEPKWAPTKNLQKREGYVIPEMTEFEKSLPFGYPGARAAYPDCTCGLGNTIEARRHYDLCALKEGK